MTQWFYMKGTEKIGPFTTDELKSMAGSGEIDRVDLVWREGLEEWVKAKKIKGLFASDETASPPGEGASADQHSSTPPVIKDGVGETKASFDQEKLRQTGAQLGASAKALGSAAGNAAKASVIQAEIAKLSSITLPRAYAKLGEAIHDREDIREQWPELSGRISDVLAKIASLQPDKKGNDKQTSFAEKAKTFAIAAKDKGHKLIHDQQLNARFGELGKLAFEQGKTSDAPADLVELIKTNLAKLESLRADLGMQKTALKEQGGKSLSGFSAAIKSYPKTSIGIGCGFLLFCCFILGTIGRLISTNEESSNKSGVNGESTAGSAEPAKIPLGRPIKLDKYGVEELIDNPDKYAGKVLVLDAEWQGRETLRAGGDGFYWPFEIGGDVISSGTKIRHSPRRMIKIRISSADVDAKFKSLQDLPSVGPNDKVVVTIVFDGDFENCRLLTLKRL